MQRTDVPELLDSDSATAEEVAASLADLRSINRWLGGTSSMRRLLLSAHQRFKRDSYSVLDVGAGSGDSLLQLAPDFSRRHAALNVVLLDRAATHLPVGYAANFVADAFSLPFRDNAFDFVSCSLFLHHLGPQQVIDFCHEALRVSRLGLLLNDLRRSRVHLLFAHAGRLIYRSRVTAHDSVASVHRAYTPREFATMLSRVAGAAEVQIQRRWFFRMTALAVKGAQ